VITPEKKRRHRRIAQKKIGHGGNEGRGNRYFVNHRVLTTRGPHGMQGKIGVSGPAWKGERKLKRLTPSKTTGKKHTVGKDKSI